ncbi:DNA-binding MarR family transcriptional regulator [Arthrobacter sp. V1I9]|jgi:DNA-binding MarR family transcriptional regulator|uniref:MarR family winged helix-turn-helix transcriptional regulator n=1 Tax=Arthrobacter sp. V1I9 TaxID=3042275 RepID=UPI00279089B4|nr:MarR family transcriptional regulator [Arthrobacter sp. V1I9]MDQ0870570.1 DNA-binding MarR family transcriptional regulator [Arthrobacter sp. V1I9]
MTTASSTSPAAGTAPGGGDSPQDNDLLLEHQLCFALTVASRSVVGAYKPVLEKLNLTHPQYLVMLCLWESSPRTVRNISDALAQEPATISPLLRRLEVSGLISRRRVDGNERALAVGLTPAGAALRQEALKVPGTMMERLGLTRSQVSELHTAMMGLIAATSQTQQA